MDIIVKAKNCEISARTKAEAIERVQHATRFFDRLLGVELVFRADHNPRIAEPAAVEVTARALGGGAKAHHIRAEGAGGDHRAALDVAVSRFERQLARYKARLVDRSQGRDRVPPTAPAPDATEDSAFHTLPITKVKHFALQPMLPDEAALHLELLGHEFYVFTNSASGDCNVVYRRRAGDLGLIEATVALGGLPG